MPRITEEKVGEVWRTRVEKTNWDKFVEFVKELMVGIVCLFVLSAIIAGIFS
tara:strand:- start:2827 stop:2982 length:156 start_codon:yes stop_codon:yes gene_type:complete